MKKRYLNTNSHKFHYANGRYVDTISEKTGRNIPETEKILSRWDMIHAKYVTRNVINPRAEYKIFPC